MLDHVSEAAQVYVVTEATSVTDSAVAPPMQSSHQAGATQDALAISVSRANMRRRFFVVEMQ